MSKPNNIQIEKQIDAYLSGALSDEEIEQLWATLLEYPEYYEHLKTEVALKRHFEAKKSDSDTPITPINTADESKSESDGENGSVNEDSKQWVWTLAAAAVVIIILGLNFLLPNQQQTAQQMALADIDIESMETPDILRSGSGQPDSQVAALISNGFSAATSGNREGAVSNFQEALNQLDAPQTPMDSLSLASAHLNLGIIYYNYEEYSKASLSFEQAVDFASTSKRIEEKAYWYLGNAYLNQEKLENAREAVHKTYALNGIYRESAYRLLRKLDYELGYVDYDDYKKQSQELEK